MGSSVPLDAPPATGIRTGATPLEVGAVADGEFLKRVGTEIVGAAAAGAADPSLLGAGSAAAPPYSFTGDDDTGIFQDGANVLAATIGGIPKVQLYQDRFALASEVAFADTTNLNTAGAVDAGIRREGAGVCAATPGSTGAASTGIGAMVMSRVVEANTDGSGSPNVLTPRESRKLLTNEGTGAENYHTLPAAAAGLEFPFYVQDANGIRVTAGSGDTIRVAAGVSATAGYVRCATVGSVLILVAINATEWVALAQTGTWTVDA